MKYFLFCFIFISACTGERPLDLGLKKNHLATCPASPNCVSSVDTRQSHYIKPIDSSINALKKLLLTLTQAKIISEHKDYIYAEFNSDILKFVDDVEFAYDPTSKLINVRSASRLGHSDFGVNRNRIKFIRTALQQQN